MREIAAQLESFLMDPAAWLAANLDLAVLGIAAIPLAIIVGVEVVARLRRAEQPATEAPAAPRVPPAAPAVSPPVEKPVERRVERPAEEPLHEVEAVAPGPLPEAAPAAEPAAVSEPEPAAVPAPAPALVPTVRLRDRLRLTSENLVGRLGQLLGGRAIDAEVLDELEMLLFSADLGVKTAESLLEAVKSQAVGGDADAVREVLRAAILGKLERVEPRGDRLAVAGKPHVILVLGVNGSGKTTTIGKLASRYKHAGHSVILGAGDTFRAAASEQLQAWGERVGCEVVSGPSGGDPSAVAFDTVKAAVAREIDVAIIDTAGRLQTKKPLMEELAKLARVIGRGVEGAPHESLLVLDANTGQNAISQARLFDEVTKLTGLVLTKLDGTAKGGVLVGLADEFGIPVKYVGVGEAVDDLRDFSAEEFVEAVFEA